MSFFSTQSVNQTKTSSKGIRITKEKKKRGRPKDPLYNEFLCQGSRISDGLKCKWCDESVYSLI